MKGKFLIISLLFLFLLANVEAQSSATGNITFTISGQDGTSPEVQLLFPESTTYSSVTRLDYIVSDNVELDRCWYSLNSGATNTSITCGTNVTGLSAPEGSNTWTIYANDTSGNENFSMVTFTVTASIGGGGTGGGGGGGGGSSGLPDSILRESFEVEPSELNFFMKENEKQVEEIKVTNTGNKDLNIGISLTGIRQMSEINVASLSLKPGETKIVLLSVNANEKGVFAGRVVFESEEIREETLVLVNVQSAGTLFDVSLTIPLSQKNIYFGETLRTSISLLQVGDPFEVDVIATYIIKDFDGNTISKSEDTFFVYQSKSFVKDFETQNLPPGEYIAGIEVVYPGGFASSSTQFTVEPKLSVKKIIILGILMLIILIGIIAIILRYKKLTRFRSK